MNAWEERRPMTAGEVHAVYTNDISRMGLGILHHEQLLPGDEATIWLPNGRRYLLRTIRCRRLGENCYECGMLFELGA
jgi:hypothetical protein